MGKKTYITCITRYKMSHHPSSRNPRRQASASARSPSSSNSFTTPQENIAARNYIESLVTTSSPPYQSPYGSLDPSNQYLTVPNLGYPTAAYSRASSTSRAAGAASMSTYSSASDQNSIYSSPGPQDYKVGASSTMSNANNSNTVRNLSQKISFQYHKHYRYHCHHEDNCFPVTP